MLRNMVTFFRPHLSWALPLDENVWLHRQTAFAMLLFTILHTTAHYVNFLNVERSQIRKQYAVQIHYTQPGPITGHVALLLMMLIYTTAQIKIRKQCFEAFW